MIVARCTTINRNRDSRARGVFDMFCVEKNSRTKNAIRKAKITFNR